MTASAEQAESVAMLVGADSSVTAGSPVQTPGNLWVKQFSFLLKLFLMQCTIIL